MKTPMTEANLAITALADSISADALTLSHDATLAQEAGQIGDMDGTVCALMAVEASLEKIKVQLAAVYVLHRSK